MVVVKTGKPLQRVFVKGRYDSEASPGDFEEMSFSADSSGSEQPGSDPLEDERIKPLVEERLAGERAKWEEESKSLEQEAYDKGKTEGRQQAEAELAEQVERLKKLIVSIDEGYQRLLRDGELEIVDLALAIARRFVKAAAVYNNDMIKETIKSAVKMATERDKVVIRVNPDDIEEVKSHQDDIIFIGDGIGRLEVRPDKAIERGGCVVETEAGNIDARNETRFDELDKALKQAYQINGERESGQAEGEDSVSDE
ncbi:FliH/SctL family protein [Gemmatimonadota bacterium]